MCPRNDLNAKHRRDHTPKSPVLHLQRRSVSNRLSLKSKRPLARRTTTFGTVTQDDAMSLDCTKGRKRYLGRDTTETNREGRPRQQDF